MSMQKGKHQGGQTQGYSAQRYSHASYITRSIPAQRPDVTGFHVPGTGFQQQGGGAGPPSAPQLRAIHHPHHGGNPQIPPQHQQPPPPQAQSQHTGGPPGPAPTSTPPGPADMGKQGPPHMQQGGQMPLNFVPNQSRAANSQPFFPSGPRGPTPRMPNHRNQVVNMQPSSVGQQMFSQHVQMPQVPMFQQQVMSTQLHTPQMFVQSQIPVYGGQPRHQNHTGSGYYQQAGPQQILMTPQAYPVFPHATQSPQYYYQGPVGIRPGAAVTGGPGPGGLPGAASQQVMPGGGPPAQLGQPGAPVAMGIVSGPGVVGVAGLATGDASTGQTTMTVTAGKQARRKHALDIVDPKTMKNVDIYEASTTSSSTPPRSGESSARDTPQPNTGPGATMDVAAEFAARVAKAASESSPPPPAPLVAQVGPPPFVESPPQMVTANGPDPSGTNSISVSEGIPQGSILTQGDALAISNQQIVVVEEPVNLAPTSAPPTISPVGGTPTTWKQGQLPHSTSTSLASKPSGNISKNDISNQVVVEERVRPNNLEMELQVVDFVPSVSAADVISPTPLVSVVDPELTPVVSAQTNAPAVEVIRSTPNREQFPALKNNMPISHHSPRRKQQQPQSQRPETTSSVPQAPIVSSPPIQTHPLNLSMSRETTPVTETKGSKKAAPTEESAPPSSAFPVSQPTKEKRDQEKQHGRDREKSSSVSSQGRGEREKSASSTSSSSSQHHGRDREKSSRDKEKSGTGSQGGPKDRDKSASQGRDRDKSSSKEATPTPSPVTPVVPTVVPQTTLQPQSELQTPAKPVAAVEEPKQQTNGEVSAAETVDGKASQHRSKPKQRNHKMRDINRKGAEKEGGTDMDAFVETPPEEATSPPPPAVTPPVSQPSPVPAAPTNKVSTDNQQIVKEEETEADKEEKLVAARNEENAKVSAAALKEESSSATPVIENIPATKPTTLQLRHTYKEDQWSPLNPEGKKKYERDFLMELQNDPQSKKKPDNLPDIEVVLKDSTNRRTVDRSHPNMNRPIQERSAHDTFTPGFMRTPNTRGQPLPKRNSQQGNKPSKGNKSNVIHVTLSLEEVKLHESDNAWKPTRMKNVGNTEQEAKTEDLYKKVRGVLNRLTPQKFQTLVTQVQALPIDNSDRLQGVINLVFEKAVDEPNFSVAYAQMCKVLSGMQVPAERKNKDDPEYVNFRKLLVNRCQMEFEKDKEEELNREAKLRQIEAATDPEKKKELQATFEEEERRLRMKSVGNIRFIGELFKLGMLTTNIMQRCIKHLLQDGSEESLECLCKLLTTIGKDLENKHQDLSQYFDTMRNISVKKGAVSSRVRFMLQDVIDLRRNKWVPRRDDSNPKTMDQIQKEAEKESFDQQLLLNSAPQTPRRQDDRVPQNRKNKGNMGDEGWNMVAPTRTSRYTVDTTKLRPPKEETAAPRLGGNYLFSNFIGGANTKKDMNKNPLMSTGMVQHNFFSALSDTSSEDSKRPQQPPVLSNRPGPGKTTPSPSMEKERMLSSFRAPSEGENWQSRSGASRSSSRDNSARRGGDELSLRSYAPSSQPSSIYASSEDISSSVMAPDAKNQPVAATTVLSTEEVKKKTLALLEEFLFNTNYEESTNCVTETFPTENRSMFVCESLNDMLERSSSARENVGKLMSRLVEDGIITLPLYLVGLNEFLEFADDIAIDVPKFWPYIAEFIVPMLLSEVMPFRNFQEISHPVHGNLILEVLQLLVRDKGPGWIREKWEAAGLKWTDFLAADKVDDFVKKNKLEYILGGAASTPSASSSAALSWDHVQQKLEQFLNPEQASSSSFDQICDWIGANVGDRAKEPQFIRALMTAICRSAIESQKTTLKLNESRFQEQQKLLLRYVDNKEELELQCLYAVQSLINQLEHPQGLLCQIFQVLWDDSTISSDSFIAWQNSNDLAEQAGKGVALKSLTTFFTALCEGEEDSSCEDS